MWTHRRLKSFVCVDVSLNLETDGYQLLSATDRSGQYGEFLLMCIQVQQLVQHVTYEGHSKKCNWSGEWLKGQSNYFILLALKKLGSNVTKCALTNEVDEYIYCFSRLGSKHFEPSHHITPKAISFLFDVSPVIQKYLLTCIKYFQIMSKLRTGHLFEARCNQSLWQSVLYKQDDSLHWVLGTASGFYRDCKVALAE